MQQCYFNVNIYSIFNNKYLRYLNIEIDFVVFNIYVIIFLQFINNVDKYYIIFIKIHVIFYFFVDIIVEIIILKSNNIKIK